MASRSEFLNNLSPQEKGEYDNQYDYLRYQVERGWERRLGPRFKNGEEEGKGRVIFSEARHRIIEMGLEGRDPWVLEEEYQERVRHELDLYYNSGFAKYFLIIWDIYRFATESRIPRGDGRGSVAASLVAYLLNITNVDPLRFDLLFSRFLTEGRVDWPDIDMDFADDRKEDILSYLKGKYGEEHVIQIGTFIRSKSRTVIQDVARAYEVNYSETLRATSHLPIKLKNEEGSDSVIKGSLELPGFKEYAEEHPEVIRHSIRLEGQIRALGKHAAGVIISPDPVLDILPVIRNKENLVAGFEMTDCEFLGLLKIDLLALRTLQIMGKAFDLIKNRHETKFCRCRGCEKLRAEGIEKYVDQNDLEGFLDWIPLEDQNVLEMVGNGWCHGMMQMETYGMIRLLRKMKPTCFADIYDANALYRPGTLRSGGVERYVKRLHGEEEVERVHPILDRITGATYGVVLYQEQLMETFRDLGGFTEQEADAIRKVVAKSYGKEEFQKHKEKFVQGSEKEDCPKEIAEKIFQDMSEAGAYGFNKCVVGSTQLANPVTGEQTTVANLFSNPREFHVHSMDSSGKLVPRKVTQVYENGIKPVFKLKTSRGHEITLTSNHRLRVFSGWKEMKDLSIGDRIAVAGHIPHFLENHIPQHQLITLGWLLADGNLCHPSALYFTKESEVAVNDFMEAASMFENTIARKEFYDGRTKSVCLSTGKSGVPGKCGAYKWINELGLTYKKASQKFIPDLIFTLSKEDIAIFLGRLWSGDGYISGKAIGNAPFYATASRLLAYDVQELLLRFKITSRIYEKNFKYRGSIKIGYEIHLSGEDSIQNFLDTIAHHIVGREKALVDLSNRMEYLASYHEKRQVRGGTQRDLIPAEVKLIVRAEKNRLGLTWNQIDSKSNVCIREFCGESKTKKQGFRPSTIRKVADAIGSEELAKIVDADIRWDRIISVEHVGNEHTYDLTVEETHNFLTNGIIAHNSHSVAYSSIGIKQGFIKQYYPAEFLCCCLDSTGQDKSKEGKLYGFVQEARRQGIPVRPPDINLSGEGFKIRGHGNDLHIRAGYATVHGVGGKALEGLMEAQKSAPFTSLDHFLKSVNRRRVHKGIIKSLFCAGAFESLYPDTGKVLENFELIMEPKKKQAEERERVLREASDPGGSMVWSIRERTLSHAEYLSIPPEEPLLSCYSELTGGLDEGHIFTRIQDIKEEEEYPSLLIQCIVAQMKNKFSDEDGGGIQGGAYLVLEDGTDFIMASVDPLTYHYLQKAIDISEGKAVIVRVQKRGGWDKLSLLEMTLMDEFSQKLEEGKKLSPFEKYLVENPLRELRYVKDHYEIDSVGEIYSQIEESPTADQIKTWGVVVGRKKFKTKKAGKEFSILTIEDEGSNTRVCIWPESYQKFKDVADNGTLIAIRAHLKPPDKYSNRWSLQINADEGDKIVSLEELIQHMEDENAYSEN